MRDKRDATVFLRTIDRSHPSNIRVVVPPVIDKFLQSPEKVIFIVQNGAVCMYAASDPDPVTKERIIITNKDISNITI